MRIKSNGIRDLEKAYMTLSHKTHFSQVFNVDFVAVSVVELTREGKILH